MGGQPLDGLTHCMGGWFGQPVRTARDLEDEPGGRIVIQHKQEALNARVIIIPTLTQRINQVQLPCLMFNENYQ